MSHGELLAVMMSQFADYGEFYDLQYGMSEQECRQWVRMNVADLPADN